MTHNPERYFPADYRQARKNFIAAAHAAGVDVISRVHPAAMGPDGKPLFIDSTALGPRNAGRALLLISGTHGVEGYFGSAVQTGLLREGLAAPDGARIVLVHALNPFGFAWNRRVNEDNVDLDRNFVDFAAPPSNRAYAALADAIAPHDIRRTKSANARLRAYGARRGAAKLQDVITRGQYRFPDGLWFGGRAQSWSHRMLKAVLDEDLAKVRTLIGIDFHTGFGAAGAGEMTIRARPSATAPPQGTLDRALAAWLPGVRLTFAALEVGTVPFTQAFEALRQDNWLHNFAAGRARAPETARACRDAFYPDRIDWQRAAFIHATAAVRTAIAAL